MAQEWSGKTGGTHWMQRALVAIIRKVDNRIIYGIMHLWLIWYVLVRPIERRGAYRFHRLRGRNRFQAACDVYRSFYHFGKAIIDRFAAFAGKPFEVQVVNRALYYDRVNDEKGFIMLFSHIGNTEMAGYFLSTPDKRLHILAYGAESPVVMAHRAKVLERNNIDMIPVFPNDMSHIYRISEVLQNGDILAFAADRRIGESTIECTLLGRPVRLPIGAFQICVAMKQPVLLVFVLKESHRSYRVFCEQLEVNTALSKHAQTQDLANRFAASMEKMIVRYPYQWFNFYDFWT